MLAEPLQTRGPGLSRRGAMTGTDPLPRPEILIRWRTQANRRPSRGQNLTKDVESPGCRQGIGKQIGGGVNKKEKQEIPCAGPQDTEKESCDGGKYDRIADGHG